MKRLSAASLVLAACLADVEVGGTGYRCDTDADCEDGIRCIAKLCGVGGAGGASGGFGGGGAGGFAGGAAGGMGGGDGGGFGGGAAGGLGGGAAGGFGGGTAGGSGGGAGGGMAGGAGGGSAGGAAGGSAGGAADAGTDAGVLDPPWWNASWTQRAQLTITNNASAPLPAGFQVGWPFPIEALLGSGSSEQIRIVRWSGANWSEQDRVIDVPGPNLQWMWLRLVAPVATTDTSYWVYWGNPTAAAAPASSSAVFDFYEPFQGGMINAAWVQNPLASVTVAGGEAQLGTNESLRLAIPYGDNTAVDIRARQPVYAGRWWMGFQAANTFSDTHPWNLWIARNTTSPAQIWPEWTEDQSPILEGPRRAMPTDQHLWGVDRVGPRTLYRYDDVVVHELDAGVTLGTLNVRMTNQSLQTVFIGMVRVRATVHPYPTVTRGPTQP